MADVQLQPHLLESQYFPSADVSSASFSQASYFQHQPGKQSVTPAPAVRTTPTSKWTPTCHPRVDAVASEVDEYFLKHWNFPNAKAEQTFLKAGFSRSTCLNFPLALDDRIHFACRLLTLLFLIDDELEEMSLADGEAYNAKLISLSRGEIPPSRTVPVEYIIYDLWESMRAHDKELADAMLEPTFTFMRAQTDRNRMSITDLGDYLAYREKDVGKAVLSSLMRFSMGLNMTPAELSGMTALERNSSKQILIVNDIFSWEKELRASRISHQEGSVLCNAVKILADSTGLDIEGSKRVLWSMVREWEDIHSEAVARKLAEGCSQAAKDYMVGLEYQMSGNELWSQTTARYNQLD